MSECCLCLSTGVDQNSGGSRCWPTDEGFDFWKDFQECGLFAAVVGE